MATDVVCPDCGGLVGADPSDLRRKCTCNLSDTDHLAEAETRAIVQPQKVCCVCGADVTGKKRAKDSRGYWCYDCHKAERAKEKAAVQAEEANKVICHDCGRSVHVNALISYDGSMICGRCKEERVEKSRYRANVVGTHHALHEKKRLLLLGGVFVVLLLIVILHAKGILPNLF